MSTPSVPLATLAEGLRRILPESRVIPVPASGVSMSPSLLLIRRGSGPGRVTRISFRQGAYIAEVWDGATAWSTGRTFPASSSVLEIAMLLALAA